MGAGGNRDGDTADFGRTTPTKKDKKKTANVEIGLGTDRMSNYQTPGGEGNQSAKSIEQPKVESQMDAIKPDLVPDGPTDVEMTDDEIAVANKKKGRRKTVLTSITGDTSIPKLSQKTLLGG